MSVPTPPTVHSPPGADVCARRAIASRTGEIQIRLILPIPSACDAGAGNLCGNVRQLPFVSGSARFEIGLYPTPPIFPKNRRHNRRNAARDFWIIGTESRLRYAGLVERAAWRMRPLGPDGLHQKCLCCRRPHSNWWQPVTVIPWRTGGLGKATKSANSPGRGKKPVAKGKMRTAMTTERTNITPIGMQNVIRRTANCWRRLSILTPLD